MVKGKTFIISGPSGVGKSTVLHALLEKHYLYTGSAHAKAILDNWENRFPLFVKVVPIEYRKVLDRMKRSEGRNAEAISATEEVYV